MVRNINPSHAAVNLPRLVKRLSARTPGLQREDWVEVRKGYQSVRYAKELVGVVRDQSSLSNDQIRRLEGELDSLEYAFKQAVDSHPVPSSSTTRPTFPPIPALSSVLPLEEQDVTTPSSDLLTSSRVLSESSLPPPNSSSTFIPPSITPSVPPVASVPDSASLPTLTKKESYLAERDHELLPLRASRGISGTGNGIVGRGAAQLHDELSGQLADMSHRLKLNALHFSSTLNEEKNLLESSSTALETNLTKTKTSKTKLSAVTSKTRGTTWLVLMSIVIVLIGWIWTYLLIRMT